MWVLHSAPGPTLPHCPPLTSCNSISAGSNGQGPCMVPGIRQVCKKQPLLRLCAAVRLGEDPLFPGRDWSNSPPLPPLWPWCRPASPGPEALTAQFWMEGRARDGVGPLPLESVLCSGYSPTQEWTRCHGPALKPASSSSTNATHGFSPPGPAFAEDLPSQPPQVFRMPETYEITKLPAGTSETWGWQKSLH